MLSISQDKEVNKVIKELRARGLSNLDIYLILKTLMPNKNIDHLLTPEELELINRVNKLRTELYYLGNIINTLERRILKRHDLIMNVYNELTDLNTNLSTKIKK